MLTLFQIYRTRDQHLSYGHKRNHYNHHTLLRMDKRRFPSPRTDRLLFTDGLLLCGHELGHLGRRSIRTQMGVFLSHWVGALT